MSAALFAKIFSTIYDSSIADDWQARVVFQDMLILADKNGIVDMTPQAISRRTNIPMEIIEKAIPKLEAEDHSSRSPEHDGKRIMRLDPHRTWGWQIVNFVKYRESATKEMLRMAEADRKRAYRDRQRRCTSISQPIKEEEQSKKGEGERDKSLDLSRTPTPKRREMWQLQKDESRLNDRIRQEEESTRPDRELIVSLRAERRKVRDEMKQGISCK